MSNSGIGNDLYRATDISAAALSVRRASRAARIEMKRAEITSGFAFGHGLENAFNALSSEGATRETVPTDFAEEADKVFLERHKDRV